MPTLHKTRTSPKDFFLYLGVIVTLYVSAISLLRLLFETINTIFPDPLEFRGGFSSGSLRAAIAALIVVFPLYVFLSWYTEYDYKKHPEKREISIRKWLVYLTLFVAGITLVVDLIVLIDRFLEGDLTTRFVFKVFAVFFVSAAVFGYFIYNLRRDTGSRNNYLKVFAWGASIVVLASVVGGFFVIGSPATQRQLRFDNRRVDDLQSLQWQIIRFWQRKGNLPENLNELEDPIIGFQVPLDPENGEIYGYEKVSDLTFKLCADFNLPSGHRVGKNTPPSPYPKALPSREWVENSWEHKDGRVCFERTIDPELYPPIQEQEFLR
jgi:hypothetical protein